MKKGKLIVIDGIDGAGKTTQIELLKKYLDSQGIPWEALSFPQYGKNKYADEVKDYLDGKLGKLDEVDPYFIAEAYASDRETAKNIIDGWLEQGKLIISNRYISSSKAHLGSNLPENKKEGFLKWIDDLEYKKNKMPKEDLALLLVVDPKVGQKNVRDKHNPDIHEDNLKHLIEANKIYLELSKKEKNWVVVNCMDNGKMRARLDIQKDIVKIIENVVSSKR